MATDAAAAAASAAAESPIWKEIERAETYLVLTKNEEAMSLASSIIKQLRENPVQKNSIQNDFNYELKYMFESSGMVLVQAMRPLGRTKDIMKELKMLFGLVRAIPPQTFVTGAQFQIFYGFTTGLREDLEEFLGSWRLSSEGHYFLVEATVDPSQNPIIAVEEYLEIFETYVIAYLVKLRRETDLAVSRIKNGDIPEGKRKEFLDKLDSMKAPEATIPPQASLSNSISDEEQKPLIKSSQDMESGHQGNGEKAHPGASYFRWFLQFWLKIGTDAIQVSNSNGNIIFGCLFLFAWFVYRSRRRTLKRFVSEQAESFKKALVDAWQLVFSYQVNPLAAVQSLPAITRGSH